MAVFVGLFAGVSSTGGIRNDVPVAAFPVPCVVALPEFPGQGLKKAGGGLRMVIQGQFTQLVGVLEVVEEISLGKGSGKVVFPEDERMALA
jgi:hypothetical protein